MTANEAKQTAITFIQELRKIREGAIIGEFTQEQTLLLMPTKLREFEEDFCATQCPFSDMEIMDFFQVVKWHYWNILYSLFGDEAENIMPEFKREDVPIMLPGIGILFEEDSETQPPAQGIVVNIAGIMNDLLDEKKIIKKERKVVGNKIIDAEYWIKTTVDDVFTYLKEKYPSVDAEGFMRKHLKGKLGGSVGNSFRVKKSINNH